MTDEISLAVSLLRNSNLRCRGLLRIFFGGNWHTSCSKEFRLKEEKENSSVDGFILFALVAVYFVLSYEQRE